MHFTHTNYKKESFLATAALFTLLLLMLIFLNYTKSDIATDLEGGGGGGDIAVNFGDSEVGQGNNFQNTETVQAAAKSRQPQKEADEALVTNESDNEDAVVVADNKKPKETPKKVVEQPVAQKPKPSNSAANALANMQNNGNSKGGDGNDGLSGNKGKAYGDPNAAGYNGGGGSGTGSGGGNGSGEGLGTGSGYGNGNGGGRGNGTGNYQLSGRKVLSKPAPRYTCNEEGMVVVEISVNNSGSVISATPGVRGTTNAAKCLLDQAKIAAMSTKFDASDSAPDRQVGKIIYNFKLTQ